MSVDHRIFFSNPEASKLNLVKTEAEARSFIDEQKENYPAIGYFRIFGESDEDDGWAVVSAPSDEVLSSFGEDVEKFGGKFKTVNGNQEESVERIVNKLLGE